MYFRKWTNYHLLLLFLVFVVFNYHHGSDVVVIVNDAEFASCKTSASLGVLASGSDRVTLTTTGNKWYISGVSSHCDYGQKLKISVLPRVARSLAPAPEPEPRFRFPFFQLPPTLPPSAETPRAHKPLHYWPPLPAPASSPSSSSSSALPESGVEAPSLPFPLPPMSSMPPIPGHPFPLPPMHSIPPISGHPFPLPPVPSIPPIPGHPFPPPAVSSPTAETPGLPSPWPFPLPPSPSPSPSELSSSAASDVDDTWEEVDLTLLIPSRSLALNAPSPLPDWGQYSPAPSPGVSVP